MVEWLTAERPLAANMERRKRRALEEAREKVVAAGMDPAEFHLDDYQPETPTVDPTDIDSIADQAAKSKEELDQVEATLAQKGQELDEEARALYASHGMDYDAETARAKKQAAGPPKLKAKAQMQWLRSMLVLAREHGQPMDELERMAADPAYEARLVDGERKLRQIYRMNAHMQGPIDRVGRDDSAMFRAEIEVAHHNQIALEDIDYSGADLSGMSLGGIDLSHAFLEAVDLTGTDLSGANLEGAVLAHALLRGTKLGGACLAHANLGSACLEDADLSGCDLSGAVLQRCAIRRCSLRRVKLDQANLSEVAFGEGVDLSEASGEQLVLIRADLRGLTLRGARFIKGVLLECNLSGVDLEGVDLTRTLLLSCNAEGANFRSARLDCTQFVVDGRLRGADFTGAFMAKSLLRGMDLTGARLDDANLEAADLSASDLTDASLERIVARNALCIRTNFTRARMTSADLLSAILQKAKLYGTQLQGANLFQADLAKIRVDGDTRIDDANLKRAQVYPKAK
jgi:uncharacterized protein YjbI with pentapeptide repeats